MGFDFADKKLFDYIFTGEFGIEKECLRTDQRGYLSCTPHPFLNHKHIQRDFCESQVEFITDVFNDVQKVESQLYSLHTTVAQKIADDYNELIWPFSNPPYVKNEDSIPVANFVGSMKNKSVYRQYLAEKYGKMKMLYSGIHLNFSFAEPLLNYAFSKSGVKNFTEFKNGIYLELAKKLISYTWLIVYLTAASPVMDGSFFSSEMLGKSKVTDYRSVRCGKLGYWNSFVPILGFSSIDDYTASIQSYIDKGLLKSASELYYPIRLKPKGVNSLQQLGNGVNHIELRMLDVNPFSPVGIFAEDINFIHLLIIYLMSKPDYNFTDDMQCKAISNEKNAASFINDEIYFNGSYVKVGEAAKNVIEDMQSFFKGFDSNSINCTLKYQLDKLIYPEKNYAQRAIKEFGDNYVQRGIELAQGYRNKLLGEAKQNV